MSIKLTDVLRKIGDDNIRLQFVKGSLVGFKEKKYDLEITFATEKQNKPIEGNKRMGIVIWIDQDDYESALDSLNEQSK